MNRTLLHRITAIESEMDAEHDLLAQCARSGQMDASQVAAHLRAGELLPIGDKHAGTVGHAMDLRHVASEPIYMDSAYRDAGYESAGQFPDAPTHSGIWFDEPEPEIATTAEAVVNGIAALLAIGFFFGGCVWLIVTLKPLVAAFH